MKTGQKKLPRLKQKKKVKEKVQELWDSKIRNLGAAGRDGSGSGSLTRLDHTVAYGYGQLKV